MGVKKLTKESGPFGVVEDGFGNAWRKCAPDCCIEVVRPGKVQCDPSRCVVVRDSNKPRDLARLQRIEAAARALSAGWDRMEADCTTWLQKELEDEAPEVAKAIEALRVALGSLREGG